jgi:hypothetical protein
MNHLNRENRGLADILVIGGKGWIIYTNFKKQQTEAGCASERI